MVFSIRTLFIACIIFFVLLGGIFAFISTELFFNASQQELAEEKERELRALSRAVFTQESSDATHRIDDTIIAEIFDAVATERGVQFFRLINTEGVILISNNESEVGRVVDVPLYEKEKVRINHAIDGDTESFSFTYTHSNGEILWLSIERAFYRGTSLLLAIQQAFLFAVLITLVTSAIYIVGSNFIMRPLSLVQKSLIAFGSGNLATRLPPGPPNEFGQVFRAFNAMAQSLQEARERDQHVSEMKSEFISTAAHQLRTPLSGIRWALSGLSAGEFGSINDEQKKLLDDVFSKNEEMVSIVNTLLNAASIEEGKFGFSMSDVEINELVQRIVSDATQKHPNPHATLSFTPLTKPEVIRADHTKLTWAIVNIVENALNYTPADGSVRVQLSTTPTHVVIAVSDTGIGIPPDELPKLFEKFSRGSNAMRFRSNGNGLGLYIAKNIITYHNGTITVASEEQKGTTFRITLPRTT